MISRSINWVICIFLAVAIATSYSFPVSTTGSEPGDRIPVLEFSDLETPAAAIFLAVRQAALTFINATQGWADAIRPLLLGDPSEGNSAPASADSRTSTSSSPGLGQTATTAATTTSTASLDAAAVARYRSLSKQKKGERLIEAAKEGAVWELEELLAAGADVAATDEESNKTALHWAARNGHLEVARRLLAHGAAVDARDVWQMTPLHWAAKGHTAVVRLLLAASADHSARTNLGWTPLHMAVSRGRAETAAALLEAGADRAAKTNKGETPLDLARKHNRQQLLDLLTAR